MRKLTCAVLALHLLLVPALLKAQEQKEKAMEIYGFVMTDAGHNFTQIDPNWFDVVRPTKLPSYQDEFGTDGNTYFSVRQTRFGVKNWFKTCLGELKTHFEYELFGTGVDAGQTTFRLRHAYGEIGKFGAGQYWSPFMDIDVFPNTFEYWGPNGMAFFRNVQVRYMPIQGDSKLTFALERPGASGDQGVYANRIELQGIRSRFPYPDLSAEYRYGCQKWGYVELAGIVRRVQWQDQTHDTIDLSGGVWGWGLNFSTNIKLGKKMIFRGQVVYGEGIENYMNDAPVDIGIQNNFSDKRKPIEGVALPVLGVVAFLDLNWSERFTSSLGYSMVSISNSDAQADNAFRHGDYAVVNLLTWHPDSHIYMGIEGQYGHRDNFRGDWSSSVWKMQASFKYNFSHTFYRN